MASHLRLHLAAPPPLHHHRLRLPRPPKLHLLNYPATALPPLRTRVLSSSPVRARGSSIGGAEEDYDGEGEGDVSGVGRGGLVGEDSAVFRLGDQRVASWAYFGGILATVLYVLNVLWIDPSTGVGTRFLDAVAAVSDSHEVYFINHRRLALRYGETFEVLKKRTSVMPFAAIVDGRQKLPEDYYKEFIRLP